MDHYYRDTRHLSLEDRERLDFDQPDAWEHERILEDAEKLKKGEPVEMPLYDFTTHLRCDETMTIAPHNVLIYEGLFALCYPQLNQLADFRIYLEIDEATALERRIERDTRERGRSRQSVITQYKNTVQPANAQHIQPSAKHAHIVVCGTTPLPLQLEQIIPAFSQI